MDNGQQSISDWDWYWQGYIRGKLNSAIKKGVLKRPTVCQSCGKENIPIEGHHEDYLKPFDVIWLCPKCHAKLRGKRIVVKEVEDGSSKSS